MPLASEERQQESARRGASLQAQRHSINCVLCSRSSGAVFCGTADGCLYSFAPPQAEPTQRRQEHKHQVSCLAQTADGSLLFSGSFDATVGVWSAAPLQLLATLRGHPSWVLALALGGPAAEPLLFVGSGETITVWDVVRRSHTHTLTGHVHDVHSVAATADAAQLFSGSDDGSIRGWDMHSRHCMCVLSGHSDRVRALLLAERDSRLYSGSEDTTVRFWDLRTRSCLAVLERHTGGVLCLALSACRGRLYTSSYDGSIGVWSSADHRYIARLGDRRGSIASLALSRDGATLYAAQNNHGENIVHAWQLAPVLWRPGLHDRFGPAFRQFVFNLYCINRALGDPRSHPRIVDGAEAEPAAAAGGLPAGPTEQAGPAPRQLPVELLEKVVEAASVTMYA